MISSLLSGHWLPLVINIALQSLFVLAATAVVLVCARKASAARRHLIFVAALVALFLIPLMSLLIPAPQPLLQVSGPGLTLRRSPIRNPFASVPPMQVGVSATASNLASAPSLTASSSPPAAVASPQPAPGAAHTAAASISFSRFAPWLAAFWLIGFVGVLGRLLLGLGRIRRMARQDAGVLPELLNTQVSAILSEVGFARPVTILQASNKRQVAVAMTWGVRKPILLLPAEATGWSEERLRVVVLHELAHIRRHDWLTQMFGQIVCALYWFHPLVGLLNRTAQMEAERACDDAVLLAGVRAKEYATHLLDVVKSMQAGQNAPSAAVAMARPTQVHYRLQSILNPQRSRKSTTRSVRTLVFTIMALLLCGVSLLRPLAWAGVHKSAGVHKQATAHREIVPTGPSVLLPAGILVELVAVGSDPNGMGDDWWTPDGKPLPEAPEDGPTIFHAYGNGLGDQYLRRALFFRLQTKQDIQMSTTGYVVDPTKHLQADGYNFGRDLRLNDSVLTPSYASVGTVLLGFPHTETRCTYRFGVASGPWETIATTRLTPQAISIPTTDNNDAPLLFLDDSPHIRYWAPGRKEETLSLLGGHAPLGDLARRVIALDKDGKEIALEEEERDFKGGTLRISPARLARIVELRLQIRPYQWAEFKDIVLGEPHRVKRPSISTPPALPAFHHTFACGISLDVPAVTEKPAEGGLWWKPDGNPLAGPLKEYTQVTFRSWEPGTHPRIVLLHLNSPRTLSYSTAVRFAPSVPDYHRGMLPGDEADLPKNHPLATWEGHDFPPHLSRTTLRYGIAAGDWKTVATIPMPTDVEHISEVGDPNQDDLSLDLPGFPQPGEVPTLSYTTTAGKYQNIPFKVFDQTYLPDVARRFVAVDQAGNILPLPSNNAFQMTLDKAGKPIPRDPANAGKTDLRAGDYVGREVDTAEVSFRRRGWINGLKPVDLTQIREFRLQVRPYEWAEFPIALQPSGK